MKPKLLLHSCCGPCSSYVITSLMDSFDITLFFYNPNIEPYEEYEKRKENQIKLCNTLNIKIIDSDYDNETFKNIGLSNELEKGKRCEECFRLRLNKTASKAKEYFGTTLTVSPHKNSELINEIGLELEKKYNVKFLLRDFKKNDGYKKSIELANMHNLYRQNYCGCLYSKR